MDKVDVFPVAGIRVATVEAGIKYPNRKDLVLFEAAPGTEVAGVFTQNRFCAAPVQVAKRHLSDMASDSPRYLLINTGYANAGTGEAGLQDCLQTVAFAAEQAGVAENAILPFSTGVIGERFPVARFRESMPSLFASLTADGWQHAAKGIMTTDTRPKLVSRQVEIEGDIVTITGIAKGAGMIKPNMATMLGFIATDAAVSHSLLTQWAHDLADASFNRITIDGDTSTNDACILMATGQASMTPVSNPASSTASVLYEALEKVFVELAHAIVRDGEGATKFVEITVEGAENHQDARIVAETVAHSPLVKTALFASDPNWGRILAAVGRAPVNTLDVDRVSIWLGDVQVVTEGGLSAEYTEAQGAAIMAKPDIAIRVSLGLGEGQATVWTCDFSYDYVKINAEYRS